KEFVGVAQSTCFIIRCLSNEINTPKILNCPTDDRVIASVFGSASGGQISFLNNNNLSYFIGADCSEIYPAMFLMGDRNLGDGTAGNDNVAAANTYSDAGQTPLQSCGTNVTTMLAAWTEKMHQKQGDVLLSDSSVQSFSISKLRQGLASSGDPGGWTDPINGGTFNGTPKLNRLQFPQP